MYVIFTMNCLPIRRPLPGEGRNPHQFIKSRSPIWDSGKAPSSWRCEIFRHTTLFALQPPARTSAPSCLRHSTWRNLHLSPSCRLTTSLEIPSPVSTRTHASQRFRTSSPSPLQLQSHLSFWSFDEEPLMTGTAPCWPTEPSFPCSIPPLAPTNTSSYHEISCLRRISPFPSSPATFNTTQFLLGLCPFDISRRSPNGPALKSIK